ncbi:MAG: DUF3310 domain-containing protein [Paraclostridium sp.]
MAVGLRENNKFKIGDLVRHKSKEEVWLVVDNYPGASCRHVNVRDEEGIVLNNIHTDWLVLVERAVTPEEEEVVFEVGDIVDCILHKNRLFLSDTYKITSIDLKNKRCSVQGESGLEDYDVPLNWFKKKENKEFHSSHYESDAIEPIEFMMSNKMDFCRASIVKYAFRAGKKEGQESLDIKKIIDYALLLAMQEGIAFTKEDAQDIIDYRFGWKEGRE